MKKVFLFLITALIFSTLVKAQIAQPYFYTKSQTNLDFVLAVGNQAVSPSVSYSKLYSFSENRRFKMGYGVRLNNFFGANKEAITAPAKLTSETHSIVSLLSDYRLNNLDTLKLNSVWTTSVNAKVVVQYSIRKFDIGFNIDVIGFTIGSKQTGQFLASESPNFHKSAQIANPSALNLLLIGDSDKGSLNSEVFVRYWVSDRMAIRVGGSYQFLEYSTDKNLTFENDRFRVKTFMPFIGITFSTFKMLYQDL
jgi:hypothetical protein